MRAQPQIKAYASKTNIQQIPSKKVELTIFNVALHHISTTPNTSRECCLIWGRLLCRMKAKKAPIVDVDAGELSQVWMPVLEKQWETC